MTTNPADDPVLTSVAAYSADPVGYERRYAEHLLDRPVRFASLLGRAARVLDLGCGPGRDLRFFRDAGLQPTGLEMNPEFVDMARRHGAVVEGDIRDISSIFPQASFDAVWAQASLAHLRQVDVERALADLHELIVPSGLLYACVPATGDDGWRDEPDGRRWYTTWPGDSFANAVAAAGFRIDDTTNGVYVEVWATRARSNSGLPPR